MDKIFTQEELYWLDDILPGTSVGRLRCGSVPRHVNIVKVGIKTTRLRLSIGL